MTSPTFLIVLDGAGWGVENAQTNAIRSSKLFGVLKRLIGQHESWLLEASGRAVGLPKKVDGSEQVGGSEIGHLLIGAGLINAIYASVSAYSNIVRDPAYYESSQWVGFVDRLQKTGGAAHLQTILSDGGIHSLQDNLYPQMEALAKAGIPVELHLALDGRDAPRGSAEDFLAELQEKINEIKEKYPDAKINIASLAGRAIAHDRDKKWEKTKSAVRVMTQKSADSGFTDAEAYLKEYFKDSTVSEETLPPVARQGFSGYDPQKDSMIFCNFRPDRMKQLVEIFLKMTGADPKTLLTGVKYTEDNFGVPFVVEVPPVLVSLPRLMDWVARAAGTTNSVLAHSEKYAHVTTFLNGLPLLFPSQRPQVFQSPEEESNYALHPMMRADDVTDAALRAVKNGVLSVVINYANPDMLGHTGNFAATVKACDYVAEQLERLIKEVQKLFPHAGFFITADHGNADNMRNPDYTNNGAHSKAPVLCVSIDGKGPVRVDEAAIAYAEERIRQYDAVVADGKINPDIVGNLGDVAPTLLAAAGLPIPRRIDDLDQYKDLVSQIIDERKEAALRRREARERAPCFASDFGEGFYFLEEEVEKTLKDLESLRTTLVQEIADIQQQLRDRGDTRIMTGSNLMLPLTERHPLNDRRQQRLDETLEYNDRRQQRLDETPEYLEWARYIPQRG